MTKKVSLKIEGELKIVDITFHVNNPFDKEEVKTALAAAVLEEYGTTDFSDAQPQ